MIESETPHRVIVLGPGRSGTSAATRLLNLLGLPLPVSSDLIGADHSNETGYWESRTLTRCNEILLSVFGGAWFCPPALPSDFAGDARGQGLLQPAALAFRRINPTDSWVWKDPRNSLLSHFWIEALGVSPAMVLLVRHPLEASRSLVAAWGLSQEHGLLLWERYMRSALAGAVGHRVWITPFDGLVRNPLGWCRQAVDFLGIDVSDRTVEEAAKFVAPAARRQVADQGQLSHAGLSSQQEALAQYVESTLGTFETFSLSQLPAETPGADELFAVHQRQISPSADHAGLYWPRVLADPPLAGYMDEFQRESRRIYLEKLSPPTSM